MTGEAANQRSPDKNPCHQDTWALVAEGDWLVGQRFEITRHAVLGRDSTCDITIPGTHLSRRHAELAVKGGALLIRDLNSSNGTFVNDERVTEAALKAGDSVRFDVLRFKVHGPSISTPPAGTKATMIRRPPSSTKPKAPRGTPEEKNWKTKPTSVGNRDQTIHFTTSQKAANHVWTLLAVLLGLAALAGLGYLVTYL